jgi:hypothetical protein
LISTVTSLVSFSIVLWSLSRSFTLPGTDLAVPGFLFWVALIYAGSGTLVTHVIGRPLIRLYFQRQHMEADFRTSGDDDESAGSAGSAPRFISASTEDILGASSRRTSSMRRYLPSFCFSQSGFSLRDLPR